MGVAETRLEHIAYADGSCLGNPGPGGWGVVLIAPDGATSEFAGTNPSTTNNRMEITAALEALRRIPPQAEIILHSDSQYLVKTMTLGWKRRENLDLWRLLDAEVATRQVRWKWVRGHDGDPGNERADELARSAAEGRPPRPGVGPRGIPAMASAAASSNRESADDAVAQSVSVLLRPDEEIRRCLRCGEPFVSAGSSRHCSRVPCQLMARQRIRP